MVFLQSAQFECTSLKYYKIAKPYYSMQIARDGRAYNWHQSQSLSYLKRVARDQYGISADQLMKKLAEGAN